MSREASVLSTQRAQTAESPAPSPGGDSVGSAPPVRDLASLVTSLLQQKQPAKPARQEPQKFTFVNVQTLTKGCTFVSMGSSDRFRKLVFTNFFVCYFLYLLPVLFKMLLCSNYFEVNLVFPVALKLILLSCESL